MKKIRSRKQSGSSLIVVIAVLATLMVIVGIAAEYTATINRHVQRGNTLGSAVTVGDSCIELLFANWRSICRASPTTTLATSAFQTISLPTSTMFPSVQNLPGFTFGASATDYYGNDTPNPPAISNFKVVAADAQWVPLASSAATPKPIMGQVDQNVTSLANTTPAVFNYIASADITLPTVKGNVVAKVRRVLQKQQLSPWNFAIFYVDPLEIHPGPEFHVTGWVHTNSDLYTAHNTLYFEEKVTFAGDWFKDFKPGDGQHNNDTPTSPWWPGNPPVSGVQALPPARADALQPFGLDSTSIFNTADSNPNNDSYRELIEPPTSATDPMAQSRYWDQASVVIKVDGSNNVTIGRPNANGTITAFSSSSTGNNLALYNMFSGAVTTNQTIQDNREQAQVRLVTLDLKQTMNNTSGLAPTYKTSAFNGIVYIYDSSATSGARRGVRLKNGSKIPLTGLTVVSNNPVYIQGDYNTGRDYDASPNAPSNSGDPDDADTPQVSGYTRAPTSVLADAVNILSNSWSDGASGTVSDASHTTVNTAIIAGIVPTAPVGGNGSYSGGAENFPRFLEDWSGGKKFTYYGSMVQLFKSAQSSGQWGKANVYSPPTRQWFFDTNFRTKPPPGSIMVYSYIKGKWSVL